jgi:hypothetical protein
MLRLRCGPADVMDSDGYPTEAELLRVTEWSDVDAMAWLAYVKTLWHWPDWGWREEDDRIFASTGGWSGNEAVIEAMQRNFLWGVVLESYRRGGHYELRIAPGAGGPA